MCRSNAIACLAVPAKATAYAADGLKSKLGLGPVANSVSELPHCGTLRLPRGPRGGGGGGRGMIDRNICTGCLRAKGQEACGPPLRKISESMLARTTMCT